jgi:hypothetical protein
MFRQLLAAIFILFLFGNCQKDDPETKITYSVKEFSADSPSFNMTYTSDKSGATTTGNSSASAWTSNGIILRKGQFVSLTVDCSAPLYDFTLYIYVDGNLWQKKDMNNPEGSVTISGTP